MHPRTWMFAAAVAAAASVAVSAQNAGDVGTVVAKAAAYVRDYRDQLSYVMATERSKQTLTGGFAISGPETETLASDVYFVFVPADKVWMAVRDVEVVNGKTLKDRENVREILNSGKVGAARALKDRNATYNLGTIIRNFNEPTLSLLVLDDEHRPRFTFTRGSTRGNMVTINFVEVKAPTLVSNVDGSPARAIGSFAVDTETGRIQRAELKVRLGTVDASLVTTYRMDPKLRMMVPDRFDEEYIDSGGKRKERVVSDARYSDFTRFDVQVRIK